jgi:diadenosine tetraphosphate (Ap4A) HIT family hydrolase
MLKPCAFCSLPPERIIESSQHGMVVRDGFLISPGHTLIIPKRHIGSFFELETDEQAELLDLMQNCSTRRILKIPGAPRMTHTGSVFIASDVRRNG